MRSFPLTFIAIMGLVAPASAQSFVAFSYPPNGSSHATGVSADGSVAVGTFEYPPGFGGVRGIRRTSGVGSELLPVDQGLTRRSCAGAASADGSVIVGMVGTDAHPRRAVHWDRAGSGVGSPQFVGTLPGGEFSTAFGVSRDGAVTVGGSDYGFGPGVNRAFRRIGSGSPFDLGQLLDYTQSVAVACSDDGSLVAGTSDNLAGSSRAWRWNIDVGMVDLGSLGAPGSGYHSSAADMTADGKVVVGQSAGLPFRWAPQAGMQALPLPAGGNGGGATAITGNGSVIGGFATIDGVDRAVYWDAAGPHDLATRLGNSLPSGWLLSRITGISDDGYTVVGDGLHDGVAEGWIATVPAPGMLALGPIAAMLAPRRRRLPE